MKKTIILLFLICYSTLTIAQENSLRIGIETGPRMGNLWGNQLVNDFYSAMPAYTAGISVQYNIDNKLSLRTAIAYDLKGANSVIQWTDGQGTIVGEAKTYLKLDYITTPIFIRKYVGANNHFYLETGGYFSYLLQSRYTSAISPTEIRKGTSTYDLNQSFDIGISAGLGYEIPLSDRIAVSTGARYNLGVYNTTLASGRGLRSNLYSVDLLLGFSYELGR